MKNFAITVSGRVQRVFFRASAKDAADQLGIKGFVRNQPDGNVYIEAEGEEEKLTQFIAWCHRGSERANVEHVHVEEGTLKNLIKFEIRR